VGTGLDAEEAGVAVVGVRVVAVADRSTDGLALAQLEARAADRLPGFVLQGDDQGARSGLFGRLGRRLGGRLFRGRLGRFLGCGWFGRRLFGGGRLLDDRLGAADLDFGDAVGRHGDRRVGGRLVTFRRAGLAKLVVASRDIEESDAAIVGQVTILVTSRLADRVAGRVDELEACAADGVSGVILAQDDDVALGNRRLFRGWRGNGYRLLAVCGDRHLRIRRGLGAFRRGGLDQRVLAGGNSEEASIAVEREIVLAVAFFGDDHAVTLELEAGTADRRAVRVDEGDDQVARLRGLGRLFGDLFRRLLTFGRLGLAGEDIDPSLLGRLFRLLVGRGLASDQLGRIVAVLEVERQVVGWRGAVRGAGFGERVAARREAGREGHRDGAVGQAIVGIASPADCLTIGGKHVAATGHGLASRAIDPGNGECGVAKPLGGDERAGGVHGDLVRTFLDRDGEGDAARCAVDLDLTEDL